MKNTMKRRIVKMIAIAAAAATLSVSLLTACTKGFSDYDPADVIVGAAAEGVNDGKAAPADAQVPDAQASAAQVPDAQAPAAQVPDAQVPDAGTQTPDKALPVIEADLQSYMRYLVNYIHAPYKLGDDFPSDAVVGLLFLYCLSNADELDYVSHNMDKGELWIGGEGLRACGKALLGDKFDPDEYLTLAAIQEKTGFLGTEYSEETDTYKFLTGCDYWGGDNWYIEHGTTPDIRRTTDGAAAVVKVNRIPSIGEAPDRTETLEYSFARIVENGFAHYRLTAVKSVSADAYPADKTDANTEEKLQSYMRYLVNYIHAPYALGDEIPSDGVVGMLFLYCLSNADNLDYVSHNMDKGELWIGGEGLRSCGKALLGDKFDPAVQLDLVSVAERGILGGAEYLADTDTYLVYTGRDYWGGDNWYIVSGTTPEIRKTENGVMVLASVNRVASIGEDPEEAVALEYSFAEITDGGHTYYRLTAVKAA